jgi:putative ABC transport system permease protein
MDSNTARRSRSALARRGVPPVLGRALLERDEVHGADPVVVIGYDLWQSQFRGAPDVIGRTLRFGRTYRTVVGVMPEGFLFPHRDRFWLPLQLRGVDYEVGRAPRVWVFGRLRDGVSREQAQAELTTIGRRLAADHPDTHANLQPKVSRISNMVAGLHPPAGWRTFPIYLVGLLMLAVTCGNVGTLMLARTAARSSEIAIRSALGAGRGRIVMQLFVESLVLAGLAAAAGLALADAVASRLLVTVAQNMPFWFDLRVTPFTVAVTGGFAIFSAVIAGLLPALKATSLIVGVVLGVGLAVLIVPEVLNEVTQTANWRQMMAAVAIVMVVVGLLACAVPTRRALRIQPVDALKEVG